MLKSILSAIIIISVLSLPVKADPLKKIVFIPKATILHFWKVVCTGAHSAVKDSDFQLIWRGPRVENKINAQRHLMNLYIHQNVDAIVIAPNHSKKLNKHIERAVAAGIKVVIIDSDATTQTKHSFIATNNYKAGRLGAKLLIKLLTQNGPLLLVGNVPGSSSIAKREQGFVDEVKMTAPSHSIIRVTLNESSAMEAQLATEEILKSTTDLAGIFAVNEVSSEGVLRALAKHNPQDIPFIAFDYSHELATGLISKEVDALITQTPYAMGFIGVRTAMELLEGKEVPEVMESPVKVITRQNLQDLKTLKCLGRISHQYRNKCPQCFN